MIEICNNSAARDPDSVIRMFKGAGIKTLFDQEDNTFVFPKLEIRNFSKLKDKLFQVEIIKTEYPNYDIQNQLLSEDIPCMRLDHREIGHDLPELMIAINKILHSMDLKLVDIDTMSDYMQAFITKKDAITPKDMIIESLKLHNVINYDITKYITDETNADTSKNEMSVTAALAYVLENADIQDDTVNYDLLKEFLEDTAPEFEYALVERGDKTFISVNEFRDEEEDDNTFE